MGLSTKLLAVIGLGAELGFKGNKRYKYTYKADRLTAKMFRPDTAYLAQTSADQTVKDL